MLSGKAIAFRGGHSLLCDNDARPRGVQSHLVGSEVLLCGQLAPLPATTSAYVEAKRAYLERRALMWKGTALV